MRKRFLASLVVLALALSLAPMSFAAVNTDYGVKFVATSATFGSTPGLKVTLQLKGPSLGSDGAAANIMFKVNTEKLYPVRISTGGELNALVSGSPSDGFSQTIQGAVNSYCADMQYNADEGTGYFNAKTIYYVKEDATNTLYMSFQPGFGATANFADYTNVIDTAFKFVGSTTVADLTNKDFCLMTPEEATTLAQNAVCALPYPDGELQYKLSAIGSGEENLGMPTITVDGKELPGVSTPITGIKVTLANTPAKVPTAAQGNNTAGTATAAAVPDDATLPTDVKWTISPSTGVSISADGKITVTPSAAAGEYTVTAASASKSVNGNAKFTMTKDPAAVASFNLSKTTTSIKRGANETLSVSNIKDQYGANATGTATWAVKTDNAGGKITVDSTGKVSVAADATVGNTAVISATINGVEKTCTVTVANLDNSNVTAINAANVKVGTDISASLNGAGNGETITWSVVSGPATLKGSATGATATFTTTGEGTVKIQATQPDGATMKGFTLTKDVTVGGKDPSAKPTVNIAITGGTADGKVVAGEAVTLTANVSGTGVTEANCTFAWTKGGAPAGTDKTLSIAAFDPATDAVKYTCVVTHTQDADHSPTPSDPAEITLSEKTKTPVTVTKKADQTNFKTGAVSSIALTDIATVDPAAAASKLTATIVAYEKVVTPGTPAKDAVPCNCSKSSEDPTTATHDEGCTYQPAVPATPDTVAYNPVTTLANSKTYFLGYSIEVLTDDTYSYAGVSAPSAPAVEADEANFVKVTTRAASSGGGGGSSTTRYTVTYDAGEHGKLDGSATERVESGKTPTKVPSVIADKGYKFVGWTLNGKSVKPASTKITAATKFVAEYEAADKVTYIQGMDKNHFQPAGNATRGQLATMLARLSKDYDASKTYTGKAPDVENGKWYTNTVNFAINQGIMNGFEDGMFRPTENIRRGEFAAMLARYLGLNTSSKAHFADVTDHWAAGYINALADAGIVDGFEDGTFKAQNLLTRAEAVKMINLAVEMKYDAEADYENSFVDVAEGAWYYEYVMPAANLDVTDYQR